MSPSPIDEVRSAEAGDLAGVLALYRELRPQDPVLTPEQARKIYAELLARDGVDIIVCEADGTLVATCMLATIPNLASGGRPIGLIEHVITLATHRKQGHGRRVLEHALKTAWSKNCCKVLLLSGAQRAEAHKLYESVGFSGDVERGFVIKPPTTLAEAWCGPQNPRP
jgi:GNAT superfamily N-acetyltransferase